MANWTLYEARMSINGSSVRDREIELMRDGIVDDFCNNPSFRQAIFNNDTEYTDINIVDTSDENIKNILMKPGDILSVGDVLDFDNEKWLCVKVNKTNPVQYTGEVWLCNNTINHYQNDILYTLHCVVENKVRLYSMGYKEAKYISLPDQNIMVYVSNNKTSSSISRNDVYNLSGDNYKVIDINRVTMPGILVLKMEFTQEEQNIPSSPPSDFYIDGNDTIKINMTRTYSVVCEDENAKFTFVVLGDAPQDKYKLTVVDDKTCSIKANDHGYTITLRATNVNNGEFVEKEIELVNLF